MYSTTVNYENRSLSIYNALTPVAMGSTWLKGTITIEIFAVTRQRLIQTGSTNYTTFDFETSHGLYWCTHNRGSILQNLSKSEHTGLHTDDITNGDIWKVHNDYWQKEEIKQGFKKTYTVHFPTLKHGKMWRNYDWNSSSNYGYLIPGAQSVDSVLDSTKTNGNNINNNTEYLSQDARRRT